MSRTRLDNDSLRKARPLRWPSRSMGTPLVDLDDKAALSRVLDAQYINRLRP